MPRASSALVLALAHVAAARAATLATRLPPAPPPPSPSPAFPPFPSSLQPAWRACGCAAVELACRDVHRAASAIDACARAFVGPRGSSCARLDGDDDDDDARAACVAKLERQRASVDGDHVRAMSGDVRRGVPRAGIASRPFGWRVFAAPWCCGECCYVAACFPCYRTLYDYVDERVRYLAEVAGVAPPAPPPIFVIPGGLVSVPAPLVGGFGAAAAEEAEENTSRSGASSSNARVSSVAYEDDAPLKWNDAWSDALLSAATAAASERTRRR
jgi:hypothetical protein